MISFTRAAPQRAVKPVQTITLSFLLIILLGTLLLGLPIATRSGRSAGALTALFTATSATCVTGLAVEDTFAFWSPFGQTVILLLTQIGGLGVMIVTSALALVLGRKITLRERLIIGKTLSVDDISGVVRLARNIIVGTLAVELAGAAVLTLRFSRDFGFWGGMVKGIWHSVAAFCNAGFDLMGEVLPYASLSLYAGDLTVTLTVAALIITGSLGFYVWNDVITRPKKGKLRLHTKIVLTVTAALLVVGTALFFLFERQNPGTMGDMSTGDKLLTSFFQSASRTAGYSQVRQAALTSESKALTGILMFIGGSPGSTSGGIKTTVFAVLLLTALLPFSGQPQPHIFGRSIADKTITDAVAIFVIALASVLLGTFFLTICDSLPFEKALFECVSAFSTAGLSEGLTPLLSGASRLVLVVLMFTGRVGIMTLGFAAVLRGRTEVKIKRPEGRVQIS